MPNHQAKSVSDFVEQERRRREVEYIFRDYIKYGDGPRPEPIKRRI
jgi:hypothetical protein